MFTLYLPTSGLGMTVGTFPQHCWAQRLCSVRKVFIYIYAYIYIITHIYINTCDLGALFLAHLTVTSFFPCMYLKKMLIYRENGS